MIGNYVGRKVRMYFSKKLNDGHHELVYGLSSHWGSLQGLGKQPGFYLAAWNVQERLIHEFEYQECPYCRWATVKPHAWCAHELASNDTKN